MTDLLNISENDSLKDEKRHETRKRVFLAGRIFINNNRSSFDCTIKNISDHGALLVFDKYLVVLLPNEVTLQIPDKTTKGRIIKCEIKWRRNEFAGVRFL